MTYVSVVDHSVDYGGMYHLAFAIPGVLISLLFNILPPLLLILYPIQAVRSCLSRCHLNYIVMHAFLDKVYGSYRNGLDGGRDMRSFSSLYFFLVLTAYFTVLQTHAINSYLFINRWFAIGTLLFLTTLTVTIAKPYWAAYMNHLDTLLVSNCTILCYVLSSGFRIYLVARILLTTPIAVFIVSIVLKKEYTMFKSYTCKYKSPLCIQDSFNCFRSKRMPIAAVESTQSSTANTPTSAQPLITPTSSVVSYGITGN